MSLARVLKIHHSRLLARHPDVQQRLRAECLELSSYQDGDLPTKEELKGMKYLGRVIHEGMIPEYRLWTGRKSGLTIFLL